MDAVSDRDSASRRQDRLLSTLERLLELPATDVNATLTQAAGLAAEVLDTEEVDIFFHHPANDTLVSFGSNDTVMSGRKKVFAGEGLPIASGGRIVEVFLTGISYLTGHTERNPAVPIGSAAATDIKSEIAAVFRVQGQHRGVLLATSTIPEFFSWQDLRFLEAVARWVGIVIGRAELVERKRHEVVEQGRRLTAEELVTNMAHGLRNYLTPMRGRIELLEWRATRQGREQDLHDIVAAKNTLYQMEQVVNDLLDVARLNQGTFVVTPQPMNLVALVQEVVLACGSAQPPVHVRAPAEALLFADRDRLRRVLENLLAVVVKFTPRQTPTSLEVRSEQQADGSWVILTIYNQGADIPPEVFAGLFHPFGTDSSPNGLGPGLYLANRIAEAHGGTLTAKAAVGEGVQMTLSLPVEEEELSGPEPDAAC